MDLKDFEMGKNEIFLHRTILFNVLKGYILLTHNNIINKVQKQYMSS